MRPLFPLSLFTLLLLLPKPLASATVIARDDARQCYLATLANPSAEHYRQGLKYCDQAIANEESDSYLRAALLVNRSDLELDMQNYGDAVVDADASIALHPDLATAYLNRGAALIGLKQYQQALPALEKAIALNTGEKLQLAYFNRGLAQDYLGDLKSAYFDYKKAAEIDPNFEPAKAQLQRFTVTTRAP